MKLVAVSVLNHRSAAATLQCLQSLLSEGERAGSEFRLHLYVLDNGSGTAEQSMLQSELGGKGQVHLTCLTGNQGFAAGHNRNIRLIFEQREPDFVWLLNNDCIVQPGCLSRLLECAARDPSTAIWGATLLEPDGETIQCAGGCTYNPWISSYRPIAKGTPISALADMRYRRMDYIAGASLFFSADNLRAAFQPIPGRRVSENPESAQYLNETFFLYFEELDLARRMKPGFGMKWCRNARIIHTGGQTTGAISGKRTARAEYHSTLSALKFTRLHYPRRLWAMMPARFLAKFIQLALTRNFVHMRQVIRAYRDFLGWLKQADAGSR